MITAALSRFADAGPAIHVAPATDFTIAGVNVTNSMLYGWIVCLTLIVFFTWVARRISVHPKGGVVQYVEAGVEFVTDLVVGAFENKQIGRKYVPFFVTLFFLILFNNWAGILPFVGEGVTLHAHPLLRPMTGDLNATLSMGLLTMVVVYWASIHEVGGFRKYVRHFFIGSPLNPLYLVIGLIEMLTDLTRVLSLSLRLFLNITIGEIVIAVFAYLGHVAAPVTALPFTLLELGVGALQAYIFVILGVNYLAISVNSAHSHNDLTEDEAPETIKATPKKAVA